MTESDAKNSFEFNCKPQTKLKIGAYTWISISKEKTKLKWSTNDSKNDI